jgi:hypothetical protein
MAEGEDALNVLLRAITWKAKGPPPGESSASNESVNAPIAANWECDDSSPRRCDLRCFQRTIVAPVVTARERCGGTPPPGCCPCYHSVSWQCTDSGGLVCLASYGVGHRQRVGDLICDGIWKPDCEEISRRTATSTGSPECVNVTTEHPYPDFRFQSPERIGIRHEITVEEQLTSSAALVTTLAALLVH